MRWLRLLALVLALCCPFICSPGARAELATEPEARRVAENWLRGSVLRAGNWAGSKSPEISAAVEISRNDTLLGWCYSVRPQGHIVVPSIKELAPVKACSEESSVDPVVGNGYVRLLEDVLLSRVRLFVAEYGRLDAAPKEGERLIFGSRARHLWDLYSVPGQDFDRVLRGEDLAARGEVGPLLTTTWRQHAPYYNDCPIGHDGHRCVVGCVATAFSQILNYHEYPPAGYGEFCYYWDGDQSCAGDTGGGEICADMTNAYAWDLMPDDCSSGCSPEEEAAVAELCHEVGVACCMDYGVCGSGAGGGTWSVTGVLGYDCSAEYQHREDHTYESWFQMIKDEIDAGRPMYCHVDTPAGPHAIVCDGWRDTGGVYQYHLNYGWGAGSTVAWFTLDELFGGSDPLSQRFMRYIQPPAATLLGEVFVDAGTAGYEDGSQEHPFSSIEEGACRTAYRGTLRVASGFYELTETWDPMLFGRQISVIGAGPDSTILDCGGADRCFYLINCDTTCVIEGLTIRNAATDYCGGAFRLFDSSPRLRSLVIEDCTADDHGGGIYTETMYSPAAAPVIENVVFDGVTAGLCGAAIYSSNRVIPTIRNVTITDCSGSGIISVRDSALISNSIIADSDHRMSLVVRCSVPESNPEVTHCCVYNNYPDDSLCGNSHDNIFVDPIFCDPDAGDYGLQDVSPCVPGGNPWGEQIGALGQGCVHGPPAAPTGVSAVADEGCIHVAWTPSASRYVDEYSVERDTTALFAEAEQVGMTPEDSPAWSDFLVHHGRQYFYRVRAIDSFALIGDPSEPDSCVATQTEPPKVTGLVSETGEGVVHLSWHATDVVDLHHYRVERDTADTFETIVEFTAADTLYDDIEVQDGQPYYYRVVAVDWIGFAGAPSDTVSCTTSNTPPTAPTGLAAQYGASGVALSWSGNPEPDIAGYVVYRDTCVSVDVADSLAMSPTSGYVDTTAVLLQRYWYCVRAVDGGALVSDPSDTVDAIWSGTGFVYVDSEASGFENGSYEYPYDSIQEGIDAAEEQEIVAVLAGDYDEGSVTLRDGVSVRGMGGPAGIVVKCPVYASGIGGSTQLTALILDGMGIVSCALEVASSDLVVENCVFRNATTAVYFSGGSQAILDGCVIVGNGTGISVADSSAPALTSCVFDSNATCHIFATGIDGPILGGSLDGACDLMPGPGLMAVSSGSGSISAEYCFWGDVCFDPSWFYGSIDYTPWTDETHTEIYTECPTQVSDGALPEAHASRENCPNPFNPMTRISYDVASPGAHVTIRVYSVSGRLIRTLEDAEVPAGRHATEWDGRDEDGRDVSSGVYFYRIEIGQFMEQGRMVLLK